MNKLLRAILPLVLILTLVVSAKAATTINTSNNPNNNLMLSVEGNRLSIRGQLICENLTDIMIETNNSKEYFRASNGKAFSHSVSLPNSGNSVSIAIYLKKAGESTYWSYIFQGLFLTRTEAGWEFLITSVFDNNQEQMSKWRNPADYLNSDVDIAVKQKADEIVGEEKDDYKKIFLLHQWVANNIYYNYDYYYDKSNLLVTSPAEVLAQQKTVCAGYANLLKAMIQSQGIPCMTVSTYSAGIGSDGFISDEDAKQKTGSNHAHVAAWLKGRWIHLDATWDSNNKYQEGKMQKKAPTGWLYFDISDELLSTNHKILSVPGASEKDTPSIWAQEEISTAINSGLVPMASQGNYRENITRARFCELLVTMMPRFSGFESIEDWVTEKGIEVNENVFSDVNNTDANKEILIASELGIVSGHGNGIFAPESGITRQEAATMLMRCAKYLGINTSDSTKVFADINQADEWAKEGILFVSSLTSENGNAVMSGVSETEFAPKASYTVEQAILTVVRLFGCKTID